MQGKDSYREKGDAFPQAARGVLKGLQGTQLFWG